MKSQTINTGGGNYLLQVNDNNKVLIIGEGYVTVWESVEDFYENLNGADNEPLQSMPY